MARLEAAHWGSIDIGMDLNGTVAIPEPLSDTFPLSPTDSVDSAIGQSPRPSCNSGKYLSYGGPGFSVAAFDAITGNVDRIPIPLPLSSAEMAESVAFSQSPVMCMAVVGETQVWVGTQAGSLHVLELNQDLRFTSHTITMLDSPIQCIASQQSTIPNSSSEVVTLHSAVRSLRIDILIGLSNGVVTVISGEAYQNGGLKNPNCSLRKARKVLHLGREEGREEEKGGNVNCIAAVSMAGGVEAFWCSYGRMVVVFQKDSWKEIGRLDGSQDHTTHQRPSPEDSEIVQLVSSEHGVWSALTNLSTISLWDADTLTPKLHITCCSVSDADLVTDETPQLTALHFTYPYLFVGTSKGDLMVFHIKKTTSTLGRSDTSQAMNSGLDYKLLAAEHCAPIPILDIFATPLRTEDECQSLFRSSVATPTSLQVLVVCGQKCKKSELSPSKVFFYELITSISSPFTSPLQLPSASPSGLDRRCVSVASNSSTTSGGSLLRCNRSISHFDGNLPRLSLYSASQNALSLLPLRSS